MASRKIFRSEINDLIKLLSTEDAFNEGFRLEQDLSQTGLIVDLPLRISHRTGFFFEIASTNKGNFALTLMPTQKAEQAAYVYEDWQSVLEECESWISVVKRETHEADPWLLLNQAGLLADQVPTGTTDEKISEADMERIRQFIDSLREFIITEAKPTAEELKRLDQKLQYLVDAASRQGKQDWAHTSIGVIVTIAIGLALAPDQANRIVQMTSAFLRTLFIKLLIES